MAEESIIKLVKKYLHSLTKQGIPVQYGILFGSWAKGQPHEWSDIDVMVVSSHKPDGWELSFEPHTRALISGIYMLKRKNISVGLIKDSRKILTRINRKREIRN
jgi:hypothetical protein